MKTIAIVYEERTHLERLTPALQKLLPEGYCAAGFSSIGEFAATKGAAAVKAVLFSERSGSSEEKKRLRNALRARHIPMWMLTDEAAADGDDCIFLFQPVERIAERLSAVWKPQASGESSGVPAECRACGVISLSGESSSSYAMGLAGRLAVREKTLLLCVNPWPDGMRDWSPGERDVSELLYLIKEHGAEWYRKESNCVRTVGNVRVISGYACFSDYGPFTGRDADDLLCGLKEAGYDCLVIDFAGAPQPALAERCRELHILGANTAERYRSLERMLREEGLAEKLRAARAEERG